MAKSVGKNSHAVDPQRPNKPSYYDKNVEARRQYQLHYNRIRRLTRRKMSKADLQSLQDRKHYEIHGMLPVFENRICCKSKEYDPERTQPMADDEEKLMEELERLKKAARQECLSHSPCPQVAEWLPIYSRWIDRKLCDEVELGLQYTSEYKEHRNVRLRELLHAARRRTAILHQQLDLLQQGAEAYDTAVDYLEMVGGGRRVNKIEFRRLYGF